MNEMKIIEHQNRDVARNRKYKQLILVAVLSASFLTAVPSTLVIQEAKAQQTGGINWGEICRNPIVDALIVESCSTLTTREGYMLTAEGERVIRCIGGGAVLLILDPSGQTLAAAQALGPAVGCGSGGVPTGLPVSDVFAPVDDNTANDDLIGGILRTIFD